MSGASRARRRRSSGGRVPSAAFWEPLSRRWRVRARVSTSVMPTMSCFSRKASSVLSARQLDATGLASRTTNPATRGRPSTASLSAALTPVLPIWGAVIVTICPKYDGSVRTSWYPDRVVVNTASPTATPRAPYVSPRNTIPSARTRCARVSATARLARDHGLSPGGTDGVVDHAPIDDGREHAPSRDASLERSVPPLREESGWVDGHARRGVDEGEIRP